jgi:1-acyl-sn-glycerol-3-phosphate acyltransferase
MIRTTLAYVFAGVFIFLMTPVALALASLTKNSGVIYSFSRFCIRVSGVIAGVRVKIKGSEKVPSEGAFVFLANHQGNCDVPALAHALPRDFRGLMKKELMRLPVLSIIFKRVNFVPVDRRDANQARVAIDRGAALLREGFSFLAFPEGTRSRDGRLGEFKKGVFIMAIKAQKPVVPITILNSTIIQPPGSYRIRPGVIDVLFHEPIPTEGMSMEDRDRLIELTRAAIMQDMQKNPPANQFDCVTWISAD